MRRKNTGSALIVVMFLLIVGLLGSAFFFSRGSLLTKIGGLSMKKTAADYLLEESLQRGFVKVIAAINSSGVDLEPLIDESLFDASVAGNGEVFVGNENGTPRNAYQYKVDRSKDGKFDIRYRIKTNDAAGNAVPWKYDPDRTFSERRYRVEASVIGPNGIRAIGSQELIVRREPLFKYAIFSNEDLELTLSGKIRIQGWIHSNKNIFIDNNNTGATSLDIFGNLTSAGHIVRAYKEGEGPYTDPIRIHWGSGAADFASLVANGATGMDSVKPLAGMPYKPIDVSTPGKEGVTWSVDPKWISDTGATFHDRVEDKSQGVQSVRPPDLKSVQPGGYYATKAQLSLETSQDSSAPGKPIILNVKDGSGTLIVQKKFNTVPNLLAEPFIGPADVPMVAAEMSPGVPSSDPAAIPTVVGGKNTRRGQPPSNGTLTLGSAACGDAFKQARHWNGQEDMFVYTTDIDVAKLQACAAFPADGLVYATRTDAKAAGETGVNGDDEDPTRRPYGYRLENGDTLAKPLMFVSDNPVWIRGNFNRHIDERDNTSWSVKDSDGNGTADLYEGQYDSAHDKWQPALILGDRLFVQSNDFNDQVHNLRRWADGRRLELENCAVTDAYCHHTPVTSDAEINAAFIGGQPTTKEEYSNYFSSGKQQFYQEDKAANGWTESTPKRSGGFAMFLSPEENFEEGGTKHKVIFNGAFIEAFAPRFATHYQRRCDARTGDLMGNGFGSDGNGNCGAWKPGGTGGGWNSFQPPNRSFNHDPRFADPRGLPTEFTKLFPSGPTGEIPPFQTANFMRLEEDPLWP